MIKRDSQYSLARLAKWFPVVSVLGPRQSGKTTLVRMCFPDYSYVNLEDPDIRRQAIEDGAAFLRQHPAPLIIDEVQSVPELLSRIQVAVDENRDLKGGYVLTGFHQPRLKEGLSQSLAGRVGILTLLPLSLQELSNAGFEFERDEILFKGFMPRIWSSDIPPFECQENYLQTYVDRDVNQLIHLKDKRSFDVFLRVLAGRVGQLVNCQSIANDIGVSLPTVKEWISILEASYIVQILPCYYRNFGKRFVKTPKVYFTDVGLLVHLLGIRNSEQLARDPLLGNIFENMVVMDAIKSRFNASLPNDCYFIRDRSGLEVDLVIENARKISLYEIKAAMSFSSDFAKGLVKAEKFASDVESSTIVYSGNNAEVNGIRYVNFRNAFVCAREPAQD